MRSTFIHTLAALAETDQRITLLTGDLGYTVIEPFADQFPDRFFNAGVAEQNMVGVATGLAEAGFIPFVYSIVPFATLRPYEFIRNGPILHRLPVRIVGVGGGFEYGTAGPTHFGLEDVGVMRMQPGISVIVPADYQQAASALRATWDMEGPVYYRLGKDESNTVTGLDGRFDIQGVQLVRDGSDILMIAMGSVAPEAMAAAMALAADGISCAVLILASVSPSPTDDLTRILAQFSVAMTVEAHFINGGIGSLVSELVAEQGIRCRIVRRGVRGAPGARIGSERYLLETHGLDRNSLVESAREALKAILV